MTTSTGTTTATTTSTTATTTSTTRFATSADGTRIAYEVRGSGPALVLVDGALCQRSSGPARGLAGALADDFTVHAYDRRGRGESGAGETPYHPDREVEDLVAVIEAAGGTAHVLGCSSGAALALAAAAQGAPIDRLVAYEAPFIVDGTREPMPSDLPGRFDALVEEGRRGDAVRLFMRTVGTPRAVVVLLRLLPMWRRLTAVAHTLRHDFELCIEHEQGRPLRPRLYAGSAVPTLVLAGSRSPEFMRNAQVAIADAVPQGRHAELPGQTHMVRPKVLAPVVTEHFLG